MSLVGISSGVQSVQSNLSPIILGSILDTAPWRYSSTILYCSVLVILISRDILNCGWLDYHLAYRNLASAAFPSSFRRNSRASMVSNLLFYSCFFHASRINRTFCFVLSGNVFCSNALLPAIGTALSAIYPAPSSVVIKLYPLQAATVSRIYTVITWE